MVNPVSTMLIAGDPDFVVAPYLYRHTHWRPCVNVKAKLVTTFARRRITTASSASGISTSVNGVVGIQVSINGFKLAVIVLVWPLAVDTAGIVHTGALAGSVLAGMAEAKQVTEFLANHMVSLPRNVPVGGIKVIHLCITFSDVP